jgi:CO dehydrogenase/acetyl-CoA synthase gamma subunit (corrinoid Fe-S protein)
MALTVIDPDNCSQVMEETIGDKHRTIVELVHPVVKQVTVWTAEVALSAVEPKFSP